MPNPLGDALPLTLMALSPIFAPVSPLLAKGQGPGFTSNSGRSERNWRGPEAKSLLAGAGDSAEAEPADRPDDGAASPFSSRCKSRGSTQTACTPELRPMHLTCSSSTSTPATFTLTSCQREWLWAIIFDSNNSSPSPSTVK